MKRILLAGACALALAACGHVTPRVAIGQSVVGGEGAFDAAIIAADVTINTGQLPTAAVAAIHADADAGKKLKDATVATYAAGGTPNLAAQSTALQALADQITALLPKKAN